MVLLMLERTFELIIIVHTNHYYVFTSRSASYSSMFYDFEFLFKGFIDLSNSHTTYARSAFAQCEHAVCTNCTMEYACRRYHHTINRFTASCPISFSLSLSLKSYFDGLIEQLNFTIMMTGDFDMASISIHLFQLFCKILLIIWYLRD